jgi:TonB family protein
MNYVFFPGDGNYIIARYSEGVKDGMEQEFRNGKLVSEVRFFDGKPDLTRIVFDGNTVRGKILYDTLGLKTEATEYYPNGAIKRVERYEPDTLRYAADSVYTEMLLSVEHYDKAGNPTVLDDFLVERAPVFSADADSLKRYLFTNVQYPMAARMIELEGIVRVSVEIDEEGFVSDATVIPPSNMEFSYEAVRVLKNMPKWETVGIRYWDKTKERVVVAVPFFMNYTLDKPTPYDEYWKKK